MSPLEFRVADPAARCGFKGPRAADWLTACGIELPSVPNTWTSAGPGLHDDALLVARLGTGEFFLEDRRPGTGLRGLSGMAAETAPGVYPVLREDAAFLLAGEASLDVLAQVCNVNFAALDLDAHPVIMTLMMGIAVLVVPRDGGAARRQRLWCDPSFGAYFGATLGKIVIECGGRCRGVSV